MEVIKFRAKETETTGLTTSVSLRSADDGNYIIEFLEILKKHSHADREDCEFLDVFSRRSKLVNDEIDVTFEPVTGFTSWLHIKNDREDTLVLVNVPLAIDGHRHIHHHDSILVHDFYKR